jgi:catechol 2,3-dioxygenase-like lactoylglutathione lyase family enzyme
MTALNLATVEIKAFIPARDFALSKRFYSALGFTLASDADGVAYFHHGDCSFLLQNFQAPEVADNLMMHWLVENVDDWYAHVQAQRIAEQFNVRVEAPVNQPWAMRDFVLFDPSGVLWRIAQNLPK